MWLARRRVDVALLWRVGVGLMCAGRLCRRGWGLRRLRRFCVRILIRLCRWCLIVLFGRGVVLLKLIRMVFGMRRW